MVHIIMVHIEVCSLCPPPPMLCRLYALNKRRLRRHHSNAGSDSCLAEVDGL